MGWVSLCFFTGAAFGYYLLAPFTFNFLANFTLGTSGNIIYRPTINDYISSLTNLILACGIAYELPILAYVLAKIGLINAGFLRKYAKYAFVIILIVAAIITPISRYDQSAYCSGSFILAVLDKHSYCSKGG
ncbi:MAG: twin-arginine translocase subunit TatC [Ferruginibacter sp.]